ncbi:hypothetical protein M0805_005274 [Coniferiporia weirii]|nr:hypothetical protein M0805_005274 [Coniferiporia weirii]
MSAEFEKFTPGERTIAIIIALTSGASILSIAFLLLRLCFAALRKLAQGLKGRTDSRESLFFQTQLGSYVACLLVANLLSGIAGMFGFTWAGQNGIIPGPGCTAQGTLIQIGDFAGAYFTAITGIHTFQTLVMRKRYETWVSVVIVALGWGSAIALGTALTTIATPEHGPLFNSVGMWCAISSGYTVEQFVVYYFPIIISALITATLYALIYLCLRGTLVIGDGIKLNLSPDNVPGWAGRLGGREEYRHFLGTIIKSLLWYPFAFITLFLPITIAGLMRISGMYASDSFLGFSAVCASLTGLANVLILYNTLRALRPAINGQNGSMGSESFFVPEERKASPVEGPKTMIPSVSPSPIAAPRPMMHGRSFPPPISRVGSPMSSTGSTTVVGLPVTPRIRRPATPAGSIDLEQRREHTPTPQMVQTWLRHQRSTSSLDSTSALLHAPNTIPGQSELPSSSRIYTHSRYASSSTSSENIFAQIGAPIVPSAELIMRFDGPRSRDQTGSPVPAITISRPGTPASVGLPPAPRPMSQVPRELSVNTSTVPDIPPVPPIPSSSWHPESHSTKTPTTAKSIMSFDHEDFEIQRVDSRERLRPAISAVAQLPSVSNYVHPAVSKVQGNASASMVSLPESMSQGSLAESTLGSMRSTGDDSLRTELRERAGTPDGTLSSLAWASLVAHAAVRERFHGEAELTSPVDSWADEGGDEDFSPPVRRMSDIPMFLRPGTPTSAGANMRFGLEASRADPTASNSRLGSSPLAFGNEGTPTTSSRREYV